MPSLDDLPVRRRLAIVGFALVALGATIGPAIAADAGSPSPSASAPSSGSSAEPLDAGLTVYTSVTQDTVDAVIAALAEEQPGLRIDVFRAPTGELDARIASELRSGGLAADVLWVSDPLSMQRYAAEGFLTPLTGDAVTAVPEAYRTDAFVGTRLLNLVLVAGQDVEPAPTSWLDLLDPAVAGAVAIPDPGFAGSAFAALGYFAGQPDLGMGFYQALRDNGAVQVASPVDVMTGVAEGRYKIGISLDKIVRDAAADGSPIELIWPDTGAISVYSPVGIVGATDDAAAAQAFVDFLVSPGGQQAIAQSGWQPVLPGVAWGEQGPTVAPDWLALYGSQEELLAEYRAIFGD